MTIEISLSSLQQIKQFIIQRAKELHLEVSIADLDLNYASDKLYSWLADNMHGTMHYMQKHAHIRLDPTLLLPTAVRAIMVRLNYNNLSYSDLKQEQINLYKYNDINQSAVISIYARGRDYHKVLRKHITILAQDMQDYINKLNLEFDYRVFTDSAPVMEVELAQKSGLGWKGKHTLLINPKAGSLFFLGGMLTNLPLEVDASIKDSCGKCTNCIDICPTKAIIDIQKVDARRCISYLTIEHAGSIPIEFRRLIGKHIYGCDECQLVCPWNKFAQKSLLADFNDRQYSQNILSLWNWGEDKFLKTMEGTAIRRIGYEKWQRNLAVVMGNYLYELKKDVINKNNQQNIIAITKTLQNSLPNISDMVEEHIIWALDS